MWHAPGLRRSLLICTCTGHVRISGRTIWSDASMAIQVSGSDRSDQTPCPPDLKELGNPGILKMYDTFHKSAVYLLNVDTSRICLKFCYITRTAKNRLESKLLRLVLANFPRSVHLAHAWDDLFVIQGNMY